MRQTIYYLLLFIITLSCTEKKTQSNNNKINKNSKSDTVSKVEESSKEKSNSDCIFDDNYKVVTKEWLDELGIKKYVWDPKNNRAIVAYNGDTLTLYQGGCYHFVSSVEISTALYPNKETDSTLLKKINDVACKFKFDNYCQKLVEGKFKRVDNDDASVLLEFEDDDPEDNIIYGGIQILEKEKKTIVKITEYYN
ncbi:hypothetical protein [Flavobacterium cerinum]|uniref:Uncharacterized protein n=1 Tax=Flavobacterium cerinum TaxID=2502784 RepID=A0ABY5ISK1_9FLAO|nr:hypothetical protein [Flavobacterium cerinum]UUC44748.1 hypothetical protein NOX80_14055 [Flavobacterium cerinum]